MASESPYDRHGAPLEAAEVPRSYPLAFGKHETPYLVAHRALGEWRFWREVLETSEVTDPFTPGGRVSEGVQGHAYPSPGAELLAGGVDLEGLSWGWPERFRLLVNNIPIPAVAATVTLRFFTEAVTLVNIPAGTVVETAGGVQFTTDAPLQLIPPGIVNPGFVTATAVVPGAAGNVGTGTLTIEVPDVEDLTVTNEAPASGGQDAQPTDDYAIGVALPTEAGGWELGDTQQRTLTAFPALLTLFAEDDGQSAVPSGLGEWCELEVSEAALAALATATDVLINLRTRPERTELLAPRRLLLPGRGE